jgi:hypothetical protein
MCVLEIQKNLRVFSFVVKGRKIGKRQEKKLKRRRHFFNKLSRDLVQKTDRTYIFYFFCVYLINRAIDC